MKAYFAKPEDTPIASSSGAFVERLEATASSRSGFSVVQRASIADVVIVDEKYQYRTWRYADELSSCDFVRRHASRLCVINHDSYARPFLPGLYVSLERSRPPLVEALPIPYKWDLWKVRLPESDSHNPKYLYAFRGTLHTHRIRRRLKRLLSNDSRGFVEELPKTLHEHDEEDQESYIKIMRNAKFSICPRGLSPSSYRLYESMQLGRCPVVISDDWVPPEGPEWEQCVLRVSEGSLGRLRGMLTEREDEALERGRLARETWQRHFSWPRRKEYFLGCVETLVSRRREAPAYEELRSLWFSRRLRARYDWTLIGRVKQKLVKKLSKA